MNDLAGTMRRISGLLAKADSTEFPEEAAALRAKAEELMARYRIEEEQLISETGEILPVFRDVLITEDGSEFKNEHSWLWAAISRHCGIRYLCTWKRVDGRFWWVAETVGYDVDVRLAEMLFNSARLVFGANLEPEYDPSESDAANIYRLRSAGIDRQSIAEKVFGRKGHQEGLKVGRMYKEECARRGEEPTVSGRNVNAKTYRELFAHNFVTAFSRRLRVARDAADAAVGALVSVGRAERVEEAFYVRFPHMRPQPEAETVETTTTTRKPRKAREITKADRARMDRNYYSPAARAASGAATRAAEQVELQRPTAAAKRAGAAERAGELEG